MRKLIVLLCLVIYFSCSRKREKQTIFLQDNLIQLSSPRVETSSSLIDSFVIIKAELKEEGVSIRYTSDGEIPDSNSKLFAGDLKVSKSGKYKFKAFHKDWKASEITELLLFEKGFVPSLILWKTNASTKYNGRGPNTLVNNKKGSPDFKDQEWLGFDSMAIAKLEFKEITKIKTIKIGFLIDTKSWVFPPDSIEVKINNNDSIVVSVPELSEGMYKALSAVTIPINQDVETINVSVKNSKLPSWHPGNGKPAWLFMDEWIFN